MTDDGCNRRLLGIIAAGSSHTCHILRFTNGLHTPWAINAIIGMTVDKYGFFYVVTGPRVCPQVC